MPREVIEQALKNMPQSPGVYRMIDEEGQALYVGKARNLKKRVSNYTQLDRLTYRLSRMVFLTASMEIITTRTEAEALLLEASLIKQLQPRYNILLKDDKSFPYIAISKKHPYPRVMKYRGKQKKGYSYFGPYASAGDVNQTITLLQKVFLLRPCPDTVFNNRTRPCLEYQIKRCSAPCVEKISREDYGDLVKQAEDFFAGKSQKIQQKLAEQMQEASDNLEYERAAALRDRIKALSHVQSHSTLSTEAVEEADIISLYQEGDMCCIQVFFIRARQACGNRSFFPKQIEELTEGEILESFIGRFYQNTPPPRRILVSHHIAEQAILEEALTSLVDHKVRITMPQRGKLRHLSDMATANAKKALERRQQEDAHTNQLLDEVAQIFELESRPQHIEVYDNSHIMGRHAIGALIAAGPEGFIKSAYRKFNMPVQEKGGDDYAMMREMLTRRFARMKKENGIVPDLVLIDGGAGHMRVAEEVFADLGITDIPFACIAKGPERNSGREDYYMPGKPSFTLEPGSAVSFYLQRLRDEAHRFAISSHRTRRGKAISKSKLDVIPGVGPKRKKALLHHFGSVRAIENATIEAISKVEGINRKTAETIYHALHYE